MTFLRLGLPLVVFGLILYKSRSRPIYFTLIPWVVGLGRSLLIDLLPNTAVAKVFGIQISAQDLLFGLVVIAWGYSCLRRKSSGHFLAHSGVWISVSWFLFLILETLMSITDPSLHVGPIVLFNMRSWFYFPISFLLFIDTYRRYDRQELLEALGVLSTLVAGLTVLYILDSGFGLKIYPYEKYYQEFSGGGLVTRDFTTFAFFWLGLVFSYLLVMPYSLFWSLVMLLIMSMGVFFSYTRSSIISVVVIFALTGILLSAKPLLRILGKSVLDEERFSSEKENLLPTRSQGIKRGTVTSSRSVLIVLLVFLPGLAALLLIILPVLLPVQWSFLAQRFLDVKNVGSQGVDTVPNLMIRWYYFISAWRDGIVFHPWLGNGLIMHPNTFQWMSYDSDWIHLVFRFGIAGVAVFMLPLIWAQWTALAAFFARRDQTAERLALLILLFNVFIFSQRFSGIVYLWWYPLSTLSIALATLEADQLWYKAEQPVSIKWGFNLNWFVHVDRYWFLRKLALVLIIWFLSIMLIRWVLR